MIVNRFLWSYVVKNVSCRKYVPSKICPILLLVENMSTLLLVENMSVNNMSVENMSVEKTSRCLFFGSSITSMLGKLSVKRSKKEAERTIINTIIC